MVYPEAKLSFYYSYGQEFINMVFKDLKQVTTDLKTIYNSLALAETEKALDDFTEK